MQGIQEHDWAQMKLKENQMDPSSSVNAITDQENKKKT